jgi:hypothetical protein
MSSAAVESLAAPTGAPAPMITQQQASATAAPPDRTQSRARVVLTR